MLCTKLLESNSSWHRKEGDYEHNGDKIIARSLRFTKVSNLLQEFIDISKIDSFDIPFLRYFVVLICCLLASGLRRGLKRTSLWLHTITFSWRFYEYLFSTAKSENIRLTWISLTVQMMVGNLTIKAFMCT